MKKIVIFFIILLLLFSTSSSLAVTDSNSRLVRLDTDNIIAFKEISALRLTLSNGYVIVNGKVTKDITQKIDTNVANVCLYLVLDVSGSTSARIDGDKTTLDIIKDSSLKLVDQLFKIIPGIRIGIISFNNKVQSSLDFCNIPITIHDEISSLQSYGGTRFKEPLETVEERFDKYLDKESKKFLIFLTDGISEDATNCPNIVQRMKAKGVEIFSIIIGNIITDKSTAAFVDLYGNPICTLFLIKNAKDEIYTTICTDIYNQITSKLITLGEVSSKFDLTNAFVLDDKIMIIMDDELLHGATLEIEYIFKIKAAYDCNAVEITDKLDSNLNYRVNHKLLTENKTNQDYNWSFVDNNLKYYNSGNQVIKAGEELEVKLILSTVLTPEQVDPYYENTATFKINNNPNLEGESIAMYVSILPPFGYTYSYTNIIIAITLLTILALFILLIKKSQK